jgi:hypothetical protein
MPIACASRCFFARACVKYPAKGLSFRKPEFRNGAFLHDISVFIATKVRIR